MRFGIVHLRINKIFKISSKDIDYQESKSEVQVNIFFMQTKYPLFSFETIAKQHISILFSWLNSSHVKGFYDEGYSSLTLVESKYLTPLKGKSRFMVSLQGTFFGFIQSYEIDPSHKYNSYRFSQGRTLGIDLLIGELTFLKQGYGFEMLRQFVANLELGVERIIVDPSMTNHISIALFSKYGFIPIGEEEGQLILALTIRKATRAIIINPQHEVALIQYKADPTKKEQRHLKTFWLTPGGKVEDQDGTYEKALIREVQEEVGFTAIKIGPSLFVDERLDVWEGLSIRLFNRYYLVHTSETSFSREHLMQDEQEVILGYKWWSIEALLTTDAIIYPSFLAQKLQEIIER